MIISTVQLSLIILTLYTFLGSGIVRADQAPDFKLEGQQKQIQLSDYRGQVVYLDFWASWCQPCRKSFTWMNKMQSMYGKEGFKVIAINLDESRQQADKFLQEIPAKFDIAFDPEASTVDVYKVKAMPSSYIIDKNGNVIHANSGFHRNDEKKLEAKIRTLIRQSTIASR
ncbi:hypothetical protein MNBD_GAMMA06-1321 [hydrothermal vent metagenome]|uniref:Thioredoxin domain-containing protein n=1 Tax=hydrothermal vent metagenome TaxID=652676 RepID=A0A3B0WLG6_9ZZZZ